MKGKSFIPQNAMTVVGIRKYFLICVWLHLATQINLKKTPLISLRHSSFTYRNLANHSKVLAAPKSKIASKYQDPIGVHLGHTSSVPPLQIWNHPKLSLSLSLVVPQNLGSFTWEAYFTSRSPRDLNSAGLEWSSDVWIFIIFWRCWEGTWNHWRTGKQVLFLAHISNTCTMSETCSLIWL